MPVAHAHNANNYGYYQNGTIYPDETCKIAVYISRVIDAVVLYNLCKSTYDL